MIPLLLAYSNIGRAFTGKPASKFLTLTAVGGGVGLIVTPYITEFLLREYGWRGTFLIFGGIFLHLLLIGVVVQLNLPPSENLKKSTVFQWREQIAIFKCRAYSVFAFDMILFGMFGKIFVVFFFCLITTCFLYFRAYMYCQGNPIN